LLCGRHRRLHSSAWTPASFAMVCASRVGQLHARPEIDAGKRLPVSESLDNRVNEPIHAPIVGHATELATLTLSPITSAPMKRRRLPSCVGRKARRIEDAVFSTGTRRGASGMAWAAGCSSRFVERRHAHGRRFRGRGLAGTGAVHRRPADHRLEGRMPEDRMPEDRSVSVGDNRPHNRDAWSHSGVRRPKTALSRPRRGLRPPRPAKRQGRPPRPTDLEAKVPNRLPTPTQMF
jgi:hypothetical protein